MIPLGSRESPPLPPLTTPPPSLHLRLIYDTVLRAADGSGYFPGPSAVLHSYLQCRHFVSLAILQAHAASRHRPYHFCILPWSTSLLIPPGVPFCHLPFSWTSPGLALHCTSLPSWCPGQFPQSATQHVFIDVVTTAEHSWKQFQSFEAKMISRLLKTYYI